jgi:pimeloyl-ACP methyl ester carboxylesterase
MLAMRRSVKLLAAAGLLVAGGLVTERTAIGRMRRHEDPDLDELLDLPDGVERRDIASHDGGTLHLLEKGEGRPIVLLHGITLQGSIWSPQFHQLADTHRVIACDLRGHGRSEAGTDGFGLDMLARDLRTVLETLDLREAIVVGHSMGGMAIMQFCGDHTDVLDKRVAGLAFVATAADPVVPEPVIGAIRRFSGYSVSRIETGRRVLHYKWRDNDVSWLLCRLAFGREPTAKAVEQVRSMISSVGPESFQPSFAGILVHDAREALEATDIPSVVVVGTRDLLTPVASARGIAALMPHAELHVLRDAGHQIMQERPNELAEILLDLEATIRRHDASHR